MMFFAVLMAVNFTVISVRGGKAISNIHRDAFQSVLAAHADRLGSFIGDRLQVLDNIAKMPAVTRGVVQGRSSRDGLAGFLDNVSLLGAREKLILADGAGRIIYNSDPPGILGFDVSQPYFRKLLGGTAAYAVWLRAAGDAGSPRRFIVIAVPVRGGGAIRGVLIAEIRLDRDLVKIFGGSINSLPHQISLSSNDVTISSPAPDMTRPATFTRHLSAFDLTLNYRIDAASAYSRQKIVLWEIVFGLFTSTILVFALFWVLGQQFLVEPFARLASFRYAVCHAIEGIAKFDARRRLEYCNDAYAVFLGKSPEDLKGKQWPDIIPSRSILVEMWEDYRTMQRTGKMSSDRTLTIRGETVHRRVTQVRDTERGVNGKYGFYSFVTDITPRRQAELVLEDQARGLKRSNVDLQRFAFAASHDLKEPLRKIEMACSVIRKEHRDLLDAEGREMIDIAETGAARMGQLIDDLLEVSKIETSHFTLVRSNLRDPLDDAIRNLEPLLEETNTRLVIRRLPEVAIVPGLMRQVFQNLLTNAVRYRGESPPVVVIEARQTKTAWRISVTDNGIGIDPEYRERIFEPFQQLAHSTPKYGTGIGLTLCKRIIERHNGDIWLCGRHKKGGARFVIELPRKIKKRHAERPARAA